MTTEGKVFIIAAAMAGLITGCASAPKKECKCKVGAHSDKASCGTKSGCSSKSSCRSKGSCSTKGS